MKNFLQKYNTMKIIKNILSLWQYVKYLSIYILTASF